MEPNVDRSLGRAGKWTPQFVALREVLREFGLQEELKWGWPCFCLDGKNVVLIHGFKEYFAILFFKGALQADPEGLLVNIGENSQSGRQMRFRTSEDIERLMPAIRSYVREAIELEKSGVKVTLKHIEQREVPAELQDRLDADPQLNAAFQKLTPGRRRMIIAHIEGAKQTATRLSRIEKCVPGILAGKGLNE